MKRIAAFALVIATTLGAGAYAQDRDQEEQATASAQSQDEEMTEEERERMQEVVCKTEPVLGSRTRVNRTCMTRADWEYQSDRTRQEMNRLNRNQNTVTNCPGGIGCGQPTTAGHP